MNKTFHKFVSIENETDMGREIKFSLVYRDMWQSSGKYVPTVDQLKEVAPAIIDMGCFDRVETNGGAFEQVNLLFGENPNKAVREWTAPFHNEFACAYGRLLYGCGRSCRGVRLRRDLSQGHGRNRTSDFPR